MEFSSRGSTCEHGGLSGCAGNSCCFGSRCALRSVVEKVFCCKQDCCGLSCNAEAQRQRCAALSWPDRAKALDAGLRQGLRKADALPTMQPCARRGYHAAPLRSPPKAGRNGPIWRLRNTLDVAIPPSMPPLPVSSEASQCTRDLFCYFRIGAMIVDLIV